MLKSKHKEVLNRSVLVWLATVNQEGQPSVSPKEVFCVYDDESLLIANIASPGSKRNIEENNKVCVSALDILVQKGFKCYGSAKVIQKDHPLFDVYEKPLLQITKGKYPFSSVFHIEIQDIKDIIAPSYFLFPNETQEEKIEKARKNYGLS